MAYNASITTTKGIRVKRSIILIGLVIVPLLLFLCLWRVRSSNVTEYAGVFNVDNGGWIVAEPAALHKLSAALQARPNASKITVSYHIALGPSKGPQSLLPAYLEYIPSSETLTFSQSHQPLTICTLVTSHIIHDAAKNHSTMKAIRSPFIRGGSGYKCKCNNW